MPDSAKVVSMTNEEIKQIRSVSVKRILQALRVLFNSFPDDRTDLRQENGELLASGNFQRGLVRVEVKVYAIEP